LTNLWLPVVTAAAVLTMAVGNLMALVQGNIKRMLAFSAIGHAGYLLAAVAAGPPEGTTAALFYVLVYGLATVGAFGVLAALGPGAEGGDAASLDDLRGLGRRHPGLAMAMAIFLLSLTGLPPTAGFLGKWFIVPGLGGRQSDAPVRGGGGGKRRVGLRLPATRGGDVHGRGARRGGPQRWPAAKGWPWRYRLWSSPWPWSSRCPWPRGRPLRFWVRTRPWLQLGRRRPGRA